MKKVFSILIAFMCIMTMSAQNSTLKSKLSAKETSTLKFVHAANKMISGNHSNITLLIHD